MKSMLLRRVAWVMAVCLIVAAGFIGSGTQGSAMGKLVAVNPVQTLEIHRDSGEVKARDGELTYELRNEGQKQVVIKTITTTCGCTSHSIDKKVVEPGSNAVLKAVVSPLEMGTKTVSIIIDTDSPATSRVTLTTKIIGWRKPPTVFKKPVGDISLDTYKPAAPVRFVTVELAESAPWIEGGRSEDWLVWPVVKHVGDEGVTGLQAESLAADEGGDGHATVEHAEHGNDLVFRHYSVSFHVTKKGREVAKNESRKVRVWLKGHSRGGLKWQTGIPWFSVTLAKDRPPLTVSTDELMLTEVEQGKAVGRLVLRSEEPNFPWNTLTVHNVDKSDKPLVSRVSPLSEKLCEMFVALRYPKGEPPSKTMVTLKAPSIENQPVQVSLYVAPNPEASAVSQQHNDGAEDIKRRSVPQSVTEGK